MQNKAVTVSHKKNKKEKMKMNNSKKVVPEAKQALDKFKMEVANEVGVNLKQGYNGDITAKEARGWALA